MGFRIDHVDARVASLAVVERFYTQLLAALGATQISYARVDVQAWTTVERTDDYNAVEFRTPATESEPAPRPFFGVIEETGATPARSRIAFGVASTGEVARITALLATIGARQIEASDEVEGPTYCAVFFEDPLGNRLEVVYR